MRPILAILLLASLPGLHAAIFLAAPENNFTTGHILVVDGGWIASCHCDFDSLSSFTTQHHDCD
ncbi:MAG: hypothetical protein ACKVY0_13285 [Prosthecobacter sp.]|uniref:hypothetical protein n=1 Tax=Prosthecobacter sp. TaxID=1965333 RepID=UPI0038FD9A34